MKGHPFVYLIAAAFAAISGAAHASPACDRSASDISRKIQHLSAKHLMTWLYANNSAEMSQLAVCVTTGEKPWLDIANMVLKAAPEDSGDELSDALADALKVNSENVMAEPWSFPLDLICHVSETDTGSYGQAIQSLDSRIKRLEAIKRADLKSKAQECIDALNENKKWMAQSFGIDSADDDVPFSPNPGTAPTPPNPPPAPSTAPEPPN